MQWYSFVLFDIMGETIFGESFGDLETQSTNVSVRSLRCLFVVPTHNPLQKWAQSVSMYLANVMFTGQIQRLRPFHKIVGYMLPNFVKKGAADHDQATKAKLDRRLAKFDPPPDM